MNDAIVASGSDRTAVVLVDHRQGRIAEFALGALRSLETVIDPTEKNVGTAGWQGRDQLRLNHHHEEMIHKHVQHVADRLYALHKEKPFERVVLSGLPDTVGKLERSLHSDLATRVVARERWAHDLAADELRDRVKALHENVEAARERTLLADLRDRVSGDLSGTMGFEATLRALSAGKAATLFVRNGRPRTGHRCEPCQLVFVRTDGPFPDSGPPVPCPQCQHTSKVVPDLALAAIQLAETKGAKVVKIQHAGAELDELGGIASILRFR